jgi:hypothetical protein
LGNFCFLGLTKFAGELKPLGGIEIVSYENRRKTYSSWIFNIDFYSYNISENLVAAKKPPIIAVFRKVW